MSPGPLQSASRGPRHQSGAALLVLALVLSMGTLGVMVTALNKATGDRNTTKLTRSGAALKEGKDALVAWVVSKSATNDSSELSFKHPGRFPCPEALSAAGTATEGEAASSCSLPAIGRLPWKTLGIDKLVDGSGEPLWYVLSPGWTGSAGSFKINVDTQGQLTVDGTANAAIALVIAPGAAISISPTTEQIAAGCAARNQVRDATFATTPDIRNYLECENATSPADSSFVTSVTGNDSNVVFNDQVMKLTVADLMPALDGVIAKRIEADIAPALATVYASAPWGATSTTPRFPFASAFGDTGATGVAGTRGGGLPVTYSTNPDGSACTAGSSDPRCNPTGVSWMTSGTGMSYTAPLPITNAAPVTTISIPSASPFITVTQVANSSVRGTLYSLNCSGGTSTQISCVVRYGRTCNTFPSTTCGNSNVQPRVRLTVRALNVAKSFKAFETNTASLLATQFQSRTTATSFGASPLGTLRSDGNADITTEWLLPTRTCNNPTCATGTFTITIPIALLVDHSVVNSGDATRGWFLANEWYRSTYYAVGSGYAPGGTGTCSGATCVSFTGGSPSPDTRGALLVYAGRDLVTTSVRRPSSTLAHYFEGANAVADDAYQMGSVSTTFNDRLIKVYPP